MTNISKVLILTVAYGQGHKSAAAGLADEYLARGCKVMVADPCEADQSGLYELTKAYYNLCVRRVPWLWSMAYSQTATADWRAIVTWPVIRKATRYLSDLLVSWRPDVVICTYPLYAYMMDYIHDSCISAVPYAVVVTDSLEISRPWLKSRTSFLFVPDEFSESLLQVRYGLGSVVINSGFPVRKAFLKQGEKSIPSPVQLNIIYGAYLGIEVTVGQVSGILNQFPQAKIVLLAGNRYDKLVKRLRHFVSRGSLTVLRSSERMADLFASAHLYIGKTGAATMFEAYASGVPFIANYALPGQEQGNLQLLLRDEAGYWAGGSEALCDIIFKLLRNNAAMWTKVRSNMLIRAHRVRGAAKIADTLEERLSC